VELVAALAVYGYMNGAIFKVFGGAILIFELLLIFMFALGLQSGGRVGLALGRGLLLFLGFLIVTTVISLGLMCLQKWAAITTSVIGLVWSLVLASSLSYAPWQSCLVGIPVVFGMLLPLYVTIRSWSSLNTLDDRILRSFFGGLQSLDRFHLE
jgi:hypothetical protein